MDLVSVDSSIQNQDFLKETTSQLEKDFLMVGVNFDIEKPVESYKYLFSFTFHLINSINERDPKRLLNLLYRIDLDEEKVKVEMNKTELSFTEMLSEIIVKREIYKVILKRKYT